MGRNSQRKGKRFQHVVARVLALATGLSTKDFTSNHGGIKGDEDIYASGKAAEHWPFRTEVKNTRVLSLPQWIKKIDEERGDSPGAIVYKIFGTKRVRIDLDLVDFLSIVYGIDDETRRSILEEMKKS